MIDVIVLSACIIENHISASWKGGVATLFIDYFTELLTLGKLTHSMYLLRSQRSFQIRRHGGRFSVAKIRSIKWKIVNTSRVEGKRRCKCHDVIYYQLR